MIITVAEPSVCNEMRSARIVKAVETQAQFLLKQRSKPAERQFSLNSRPRVPSGANELGQGIKSVTRKDAPVNHSKRMHPPFFDQDRAGSLYGGDNLSRKPLLEGLPLAVVARFENPFYCIPRALLLAKRDGAGDDLAAVGMRHGTYGRGGEQDSLANDLERWRAGKGMHPEEHTRDGAGRALTLPVAHDGIRHKLEEGVLRRGYV
jgi:hypothetical protein